MEEQPATSEPRPSEYGRSSIKSVHSDVCNLWSMATLSQGQVNASLAEVCENFDDDGRDIGKSTRTLSLKEKFSLQPEEQASSGQEGGRNINQGYQTELDKSRFESSINIAEHIAHGPYWEEQQNRLPLPLMELMENEALEILTKALHSYKSKIGRSHFMTKELRRYIEGLRKRQIQRQNCIA